MEASQLLKEFLEKNGIEIEPILKINQTMFEDVAKEDSAKVLEGVTPDYIVRYQKVIASNE